MMLVTKERSLSGSETVHAIDYPSFIGRREQHQTITSDLIRGPKQAFIDKHKQAYHEQRFNLILRQITGQIIQEQQDNQHDAKHQSSQDRPRRGSLGPLDLPFEGFKDLLILDNDYFLTICDDDVKLYSDNGDLIDKLKLTCTPLSLSRFGERCVVITCYSRRLCMVTIDDSMTLSLQLEVETAIQYCSVSQLRDGELICIGLESAVLHRLVYKAGTVSLASVLPLVKFGVTVRQELSYRYVHVTSSGQIIIADRMSDYILSLSIKGNWKIPFFYRPQSIISDKNHIYIAQGGGLNLVYRFNLNGSNAVCILRKAHGLVDPWGLSLNRNRKLMVTNNAEGQPGVRVFTGLDSTVLD